MLFYSIILMMFIIVMSNQEGDDDNENEEGCIRTRAIFEPCYGLINELNTQYKSRLKPKNPKAEYCSMSVEKNKNGEPLAECPFAPLDHCQRRLSITLKLTNKGKTNEKIQYIVLDHAYDVLSKERVRLLNPLMVKIKQIQLHELYPMEFLKRVNGGPKEVVTPSTPQPSTNNENREKRFCVNGVALCDEILNDYEDQPKEGFCCSSNNYFNEMMEMERLKAVENDMKKYNDREIEFPNRHYNQLLRIKRQVRSLDEASKSVVQAYSEMPFHVKRESENTTAITPSETSISSETLSTGPSITTNDPQITTQENSGIKNAEQFLDYFYSNKNPMSEEYLNKIESKESARNFIDTLLKSLDKRNVKYSNNNNNNMNYNNNREENFNQKNNTRSTRNVNDSKKFEINKPLDLETNNKLKINNSCSNPSGHIIEGIDIKDNSPARNLHSPNDNMMNDLINQASSGIKSFSTTISPQENEDIHERRRKEIALLMAGNALHTKGQRIDARVGDKVYKIYRCGKFIKKKHKLYPYNGKRKRRMITKRNLQKEMKRLQYQRRFRDANTNMMNNINPTINNQNINESEMLPRDSNMTREQSFNGETTAHCLENSKVWFNEYSIGEPYIQHNIYLQLFERVTRPKGGHEWIDRTGGKNLNIGSLTPCVADKGITIAYLSFDTSIKHPKLNYKGTNILIPDIEAKGGGGRTLTGPVEYLVVPKTNVEGEAKSRDSTHICDHPGVNVDTFISQPKRCSRTIGSCLKNQPLDLINQDREAIAQGLQPQFFLGGYGNLPRRPIREIDQNMYLALDFDKKHESSLDISLVSDLNLAVSENSMHARVSLVYVESTFNQFTVLTIVITNMGLALSVLQPRISKCSSEAPPIWLDEGPPFEFVAIPPKSEHTFRQRIDDKVKYFTCQVEVVNVDEIVVASREMIVNDGKRCICAWHCECICQGHNDQEKHLQCTSLPLTEYHRAGYFGDLPPNRGKWPCDIYCYLIFLLLLLMLLFIVAALIKCCLAYYEYKRKRKFCNECCETVKKKDDQKEKSCHYCCSEGDTKCFKTLGSKIKSWFQTKPNCYTKSQLEEETKMKPYPKYENQCFGNKSESVILMNVREVNDKLFGLATSSGEESRWIYSQQTASQKRLDDWRKKNQTKRYSTTDENWTDWVVEQQIKSQNRLSVKRNKDNETKLSRPYDDERETTNSSNGSTNPKETSSSNENSDTDSELSYSTSSTSSTLSSINQSD